MPKTKNDVEKIYNNLLGSILSPRPYADGMLAAEAEIQGEYTIPYGLTEQQAKLVTLGAIMDEHVIEQAENFSSPAGTMLDWKRTFLFRDFLGHDEERTKNYYKAINDGRALAKLAFEEYAKGDHTKVNEMIARASKSITNEYVKRTPGKSALWFNTNSAMQLVIDSSDSPEMKELTGYNEKIEKIHAAYEPFHEMAKESFIIADEFEEKAKNHENLKEIPDYEEKLAAISVNAKILDAYESENSKHFNTFAEIDGYDMLPEGDDGMPVYDYLKYEKIAELDRSAALERRGIYPGNIAAIFSDPEKAQAFKKEYMDKLKATDEYKTAVDKGGNSVFMFGFKVTAPEQRTEEQIQADNAKWENYKSQYEKDAEKYVNESIAYTENIKNVIDGVKKDYNLSDIKIISKEAHENKYHTIERTVLNKVPLYLADAKSGRIFRLSTEDSVNFKVEETDVVPGNAASYGHSRSNQYASAALSAVRELSPLMNTVEMHLGKGNQAAAEFSNFINDVNESLENFSDEAKQKLIERGGLLRDACNEIDNDELKNAIGKAIDGLSEKFAEVDRKIEEEQAYEKATLDRRKSPDISAIAEAVNEHEKYAEAEKLLNKPKAAGDRNLETKAKLSPMVSAIEKDIEGNPELTEKYGGALEALKSLDVFTNGLYERDENGQMPVFDKEKQSEYFRLSGEAFKALNVNINSEALHANIKRAFGDIGVMLNRDAQTMADIVPDGKTSIAGEIEKAEPIKVNATEKEFSSVGAASNSRTAMTITKDGQEIKGFFTAEKTFAYDEEKFTNAANEAFDNHEPPIPEIYREALLYGAKQLLEGNNIMNTVYDGAAEYAKLHGINGKVAEEDDLGVLDVCSGNLSATEPFQSILGDYQNLSTQYASYMEADKGTNISNRNVAMSRVANVLGVPNLLARSDSMQLVNGDKVINGVFMENAVGKGYDKILPDDIKDMNEHPFDNPSVLKDIADIQILDFICQNIDRHENNLFYKLSEDGKTICGVQGIDNDLSFGNAVVGDDENIGNAHVAFNRLGYISSSMNEKINSLDESVFRGSLSGLGLSEKEIESTVGRVSKLKQAVSDGKIQVLSDEDFAKKSIDELAKGYTSGSVFARCNKMDKSIKKIAESNLSKKNQHEKDLEKLSEDEKKPFTFEKVEALNGISEEQFKMDGIKADEYNEQIRASQKSIWGKGSPAFRKIESSMNNFTELAKNMPKEPTQKDYLKFQASMDAVLESANTYLKQKGDTSKNKKTQGRIDLAKSIREHFTERLDSFKHDLHRKDEIEVEESNAKLKAAANKLGGVAQSAAAKAEQQIEDMKKQGLSPRIMDLQISAITARQKMKFQAEGTISLVDKDENARCIAKVVLNDIILRERLQMNGNNFKLDANSAKTYQKGPFEKAVEAGKTEDLISTISKLDSVQKEAANATPESLRKLTQPGGISELSTKAIGDFSKAGKAKDSPETKSLVNENEKQIEDDFILGGDNK